MKRVLFVDDEPYVLSGLRRMLRDLQKAWRMEFVGSASEALSRIEAEPFDVVVSDVRMPEMNGLELLAAVMDQWPETVRLILSGQSDRETMVRSVGVAHQFLAKPCDADTLRSAVMRACTLREQLASAPLRQLVARLRTLPSVPGVYQAILDKLRSPDVSAQQLGQLIAQDVAMTTKILQVVNSSFVGLRQSVSDPVQATVLLGSETIRALVLSAGVFSQFKADRRVVDDVSRHSMAVARLATSIADAEMAGVQTRNEAFMAGLLHDVGKLVLLESFPDYADCLTNAQGDDVERAHSEMERFGATQAQIGGYLLGLWGLPDSIVEAVTYHQCPALCTHDGFSPLTLLHAAHAITIEGRAGAGEPPTADLDYLERLGLKDQFESWRGLRAEPSAEPALVGG